MRLWVRLRQNGALKFEVGDNGPGLRPRPGGNHGLHNMRDRIEAIGGQLSIEAAPGPGTRVRGVVPLQEASAPRTQRRHGAGRAHALGT
jgi:signal transduction histidine kinase